MNQAERILEYIVKGIWAGIMIAIGCIVYLNAPNRIVGAVLFSIGLITIMMFDFKLYTGVVGFANNLGALLYSATLLIPNGIGAMLCFFFPTNGADELWAGKMSQEWYEAVIRGFVCGVIIFTCVVAYKAQKQPFNFFVTAVGIPAFILCGAEHSIADLGFMFAAKAVTWDSISFILLVALGNWLGALLVRLGVMYGSEKEK